jgi:hypothetical protein
MLQLNGENLVGGNMPNLTTYSQYNVLNDFSDDGISGQTVSFIPTNMSTSSSLAVQAVAQAFLDDIGAYGVKFVFDSLQPIINQSFDTNGRWGGYFSVPIGKLEIGTSLLFNCP